MLLSSPLIWFEGVLRLLGRACTFDDLEELSNIGAETHRRFFHVFVQHGAKQLKLETAAYERGDKDVLDKVEMLYAANGFPGCVVSTDCVRVVFILMKQNKNCVCALGFNI